jgi:hypothetical protein
MGHLKIANDHTGNLTHNLPFCGALPQPTVPAATPPPNPKAKKEYIKQHTGESFSREVISRHVWHKKAQHCFSQHSATWPYSDSPESNAHLHKRFL